MTARKAGGVIVALVIAFAAIPASAHASGQITAEVAGNAHPTLKVSDAVTPDDPVNIQLIDNGGGTVVVRVLDFTNVFTVAAGDGCSVGFGFPGEHHLLCQPAEKLQAKLMCAPTAFSGDGTMPLKARVKKCALTQTYGGGGGEDNLKGADAGDNLFGNGGQDKVNGGKGNDQVRGGLAEDKLVGAAGDDVIYNSGDGNDVALADGAEDKINCGSGVDTAYAEAIDKVAGNCETVVPVP